MGASDWAVEMAQRLEDEFGTAIERNHRLTGLIRWFVSNPEYEELFNHTRQDEASMFSDDLPAVLREQPGSTIEDRWNHLMAE